MISINTKNILFICGGAFEGIERKIGQRLNTQTIGYGVIHKTAHIDRKNLLQYVAPSDLKNYGLIPEIVGRLPVLSYLKPLDNQALRRILTEPKNAIIKQYIHLFKLDGVKLSFEKEALDLIVEKAVAFKLGARGLRSICEVIMVDAMYDFPSSDKKSLQITRAYAEEKLHRFSAQRLNVA
jgi:ATP-dependent Clp protease ATP-binding subunit ClpX